MITETTIAYPVNYKGKEVYSKPFEGTGFGVVFEEDAETGYFYGTNEKVDDVFDALLLYNVGDSNRPKEGDEIFIVWNSSLQKAGLYFHQRFQAVFDFKHQMACCRSGFPVFSLHGKWPKSSHAWDEKMTAGLNP